MKKHIMVIFVGFFLCCNSARDPNSGQGQELLDEFDDSPANDGKDSLTMKVCDFFEESSEGGEIRGYYNKTRLRRIEVELFNELGKVYKEFTNNVDAGSFAFEQRYIFYDKPFYEKGFKIVDSVLIVGSASNGFIIDKTVTGGRLSDENVNRILSQVNLSRDKYADFLRTCSSK